MTLKDVLKFGKQDKLAVSSTIEAEGKPQSAVVEFGELDDLTIIIDTLKDSRKYQNLQDCPHVALVIGQPKDAPPLVRIHRECLTGDALGSRKSD